MPRHRLFRSGIILSGLNGPTNQRQWPFDAVWVMSISRFICIDLYLYIHYEITAYYRLLLKARVITINRAWPSMPNNRVEIQN